VNEFRLTYPDTPPSFNAVGHSGSRWAWTKAKKDWQKTFEDLLLAAAVPRGQIKIEARAVLTFTTARRRDAVNYRTVLEKCLGDALVNGRWLADDTPAEFSFGEIEFQVGAAPSTELILVTPPRCKGHDPISSPAPPPVPPDRRAAAPRRWRRRIKG
jgi:hypothetical protein